MTKEEFDALKMTIPGAKPFAADAGTTGTEPGLIAPGATSGAFSMPDGFNATFDSAPTSTGSNMVQRGQINYIGKMASYAPFLGQTGGSFWGFDPAVCVAIGGYPKDAILTLVKDGCYLKIISLRDNNMVDFTGSTDTTQAAYADIVNGSVDGVNWQYLSLDPQTLIDQSVLVEIPSMSIEREMTLVNAVFKAQNKAALVVTGGIEATFEKTEVEEGETPYTYTYGLTLVVSAGQTSLDALSSWKPATGSTVNGTVIYHYGSTARDAQVMVVEDGKYYAIGLYGVASKVKPGETGFSPIDFKITSSTLKVKMVLG